MGGRPVVAVNLVGWPRDVLPAELLREVLRGGLDVARAAGCHVGGGHSIDDPEPKYGMAVTGVADPHRLLRNDAAARRPADQPDQAARRRRAEQPAQVDRRGLPAGGRLDGGAERRRLARPRSRPGVRAATDVTGFGLLGHLYKMMRASGRRGGDRRRRGALPRRRARGAARRLRQRRHPAQPRLGAPAPATPRSTRTSCCCWPTPRPAAACSWSARCPARRWSARPSTAGSSRSPSADARDDPENRCRYPLSVASSAREWEYHRRGGRPRDAP